MQDIAELERRIASALDRISRKIEGQGGADTARLAEQLDEERMANAQLAERLRVLKEANAREKAEIAALTDKLTLALSQREAALSDLQAALGAASDELASLRQAAERGSPSAHQINRALLAEVEGLRALRAADAAGIAAVLSELDPIVKEAEDHA